MAPATSWKEVTRDGEAARFEEFATVLGGLQRRQPALGRALHHKPNLGVEAALEVLPGLSTEAAQGMFATPRTYRAVVRYSNGAPRRQSDARPDVRGIAVKVLGVDGKKVIPGLEDATTQDFLAIRTSRVPVRDATEFLALVQAATSPALLPFKLIGALGLGRAVQVLRAALPGLTAPQSPLAATTYFSALPIAWGPYAVQFSLAADDPPAPHKVRREGQLGEDLTVRLRERAVTYAFRIRFFEDERTTPIEDASVEWGSAWQTVGRLTLPVQDATSARGRALDAWVESLSFDPWHARAEHRPLGNMMRARNVAYRASTQARGAAAEPTAFPTL
jgi:hypothetical protein